MSKFTLKQPIIHTVQCPILSESTLSDISDFVRKASSGYTKAFRFTTHGSIEFSRSAPKGSYSVEVRPGAHVVTGVQHATTECPVPGAVIRSENFEPL